jgi:hypothetical protein
MAAGDGRRDKSFWKRKNRVRVVRLQKSAQAMAAVQSITFANCFTG